VVSLYKSGFLRHRREKMMVRGSVMWHIYVSNLPTAPGKPVTIRIGEEVVFRSDTNYDSVTTHFDSAAGAYGSDDFFIEIPSMDFKGRKTFDHKDGAYLQFQYRDLGLGIVQQKNKF